MTPNQANKIFKDAAMRALEVGGPQWFSEKILNLKGKGAILDWQAEGIEAVLDVRRKALKLPTAFNHDGKPRVTVRSGHGTGKTFWLALLMHVWNFTTYGRIACTAPKADQLKTRLWSRYRYIKNKSIPEYQRLIDVQAMAVKIAGDPDWGAQAETASEPENLAGYHDHPQLFIIDEASSSRLDPMFPTIEGALTTPGSVLAMIGNPTRTTGEFYASHCNRKLDKNYYRMHINYNHARKLLSDQWATFMREKYGADSAVYKVRVLGEFTDTEQGQLISMGWVQDARDKEFVDDGSLSRLTVSVDVADGGADFSVVTVARRYDSFIHLIRQKKFSFPSSQSPILAARAGMDAFDEFGGSAKNGDTIVIDSIGVGAGSAGYALDQGYPVVSFKGGSDSDDNTLWRNRRVQSYLAMRDDFRDGRIVLDDGFVQEDEWDEVYDQLCAIKSRPGIERVEDLESKDTLVKRTGKSPDRADSISMIWATQSPKTARGFSDLWFGGDMATSVGGW